MLNVSSSNYQFKPMQDSKKRGPKPKAPGKKKVQVRFFIKQEIVEKYGTDKLLRPEIVKQNEK